ncbi:jg6742 [Pararge aegeria aegeria]|uniref:Jg6742 protein n=1 Tax=Pararge aegeria aegeria TaxID=348720 RepID=A0A8S4R588_9NEOP|nr:jg6742 [Pararge aegeria aegeria]
MLWLLLKAKKSGQYQHLTSYGIGLPTLLVLIIGRKFTTRITDSPLCRACMETEETPRHVILQCNGVAEQRAAHLGSSALLYEALGDLGGLLSFWNELGWLE